VRVSINSGEQRYLLLKLLVSLKHALLEKLKVHQILFDFNHRQVGKHVSNLRGSITHEQLDEIENGVFNSLLVIWVSFGNITKNRDSIALERSRER